MDFIAGPPNTSKQHDAIMVVVDKLRKMAHFVVVKSKNLARGVAQMFIKEIMRLHGIPKKII